MDQGWIKLHRKFTKWEWYDTPNIMSAFIHCLFKASFKDKKWRGKTINRGQFPTGISKFGAEIGLSFQEVRTAWRKLESTGEITINSTSQGTIITVCNYDTYQKRDDDPNNQNNNQITNEQQSTNKQSTTIKNVKNVKNVKKQVGNEGGADTREDSDRLVYEGKTWQTWFEIFWEKYPDRGPARNPKKKSKDYFKRIMVEEGVNPKEIIIGATVYARSVKDLEGEDRRSIPMASTWLNGYEFNDYYRRYQKRKDANNPKGLKQRGFLTEDQAEQYSQTKFREPLEQTKTAFDIYEKNGQKYYKPKNE